MSAYRQARKAWQGVAASAPPPKVGLASVSDQPIADTWTCCVTAYVRDGWPGVARYLEWEGIEPNSDLGQALSIGAMGVGRVLGNLTTFTGRTAAEHWADALLRKQVNDTKS